MTGPRDDRRGITFYANDAGELHALIEVARAAHERGYRVRLTDDPREATAVGFFSAARPDTSDVGLSIVMLSSLAQEQWPHTPSLEPNLWSSTPWDGIDIGLLPGRAWAECWASVSWQPTARPRIGVFDAGWPKADRAFRNPVAYARRIDGLRASLGIGTRPAVLYAPSFGSPEKQEDVVTALVDADVDVLIKQAFWPSENERQREITARHAALSERIHVLDPRMNIMDCLAMSDIVISEESTCLVEGLLFGIPALVPVDWTIPAVAGWPEAPCTPPPHAIRTTRSQIRPAVEAALRDPDALRPELARLRDHHFSHVGRSSSLILDIIEAVLDGRPTAVAPLTAVAAMPSATPAAVATPPAGAVTPEASDPRRSVAEDDAPSAEPARGSIVVEDWGPTRVELGTPFNVQPPGPVVEMVRMAVEDDGLPAAWLDEIARPRSALWFRTAGATHETIAYLDGKPIRTWVTIDGTYVTAPVSDGLLGSVGPHIVQLRDKIHGRTSDRLLLEVVPPPPPAADLTGA